jgi:hypothetical protein
MEPWPQAAPPILPTRIPAIDLENPDEELPCSHQVATIDNFAALIESEEERGEEGIWRAFTLPLTVILHIKSQMLL